MPLIFADLTSAELERLARDRAGQTVFFFPVGGFEDHGPHLPLSLDLDEASEHCRRMGAMLESKRPGWTAVLMPTAPFAVDPVTSRFALRIRAHVLRDWLVDAAHSLRRMGFVHAVCFSGSRGPRQLTAIEEAGKSLSRLRRLRGISELVGIGRGRAADSSASFASLTSGLTEASDLRHSAWWPAPLEHGGARDTSVALALGRVRPAQPPQKPLPDDRPQEGPQGLLRVLRIGWARRRRQLQGYWGNPSAATQERGERYLNDDVEALYSRLSALLDGANPDKLFRSWYSVLPGNGSFFKAWVLLMLFILSLGLWAQWLTSNLS